MKVLSISMDRKLFEENSSVFVRTFGYASKMEEMHVIVFSLRNDYIYPKKVGNLYLYPTNSKSRISFLFDAYKLGKKIIIKNKFSKNSSVISAQDPMGIIGYALSKKFKLPLQLQIHTDIFNPYFKNSLTTKANFWYSGWVHVPLTKFLIKRVQGLRVVSPIIADSIKKKFPNLKTKIDILPVYVDVDKFVNSEIKRDIKKDFPKFGPIILAASRLTKEKRIDVALSSFKKVVEKIPTAGLVIVGSGPEKNNIEKKVKQLGLSKNVALVGWQDDLFSYYKTADIFLLTSEYEGYGMTLVEAGATGCPIVTTKVGIAQTDIFKDGVNSFICPVGDVDCLANRIIELLSDDSKRQLFKERMQASIKSVALGRQDYVDKYIALLQGLIK